MNFALRLVSAGHQKIHVIMEIRKANGSSLRDAKALADQGGTVAEGLALQDAEAAAVAFRRVGALVEVIPTAEDSLLAYDPHDGLDQKLLEVFRIKRTVATRYRKIGCEGESMEVVELPSEEAARAQVVARVGERTLAASEAEAYAALTTRHPGLERAIVEALDADEPRLVYADWLIEQGDVCGERLIQALCGKRTDDHAALMLGPAATFVTYQQWQRGLLTSGRINLTGDAFSPQLEVLFRSIGALSLQKLDVTHDVARVLAGHVPPALDDLRIDGRLSPQATDAAAMQRLGERVRRLEISGAHSIAFTLRSARLESLVVHGLAVDGTSVEKFLDGADLPNLRELRINVRGSLGPATPAYFGLDAPRLAKLSVLGPVDLAALARAPILTAVQRLRLTADRHSQAELLAARPLLGSRQVQLQGWSEYLEGYDLEALQAAGYALHLDQLD